MSFTYAGLMAPEGYFLSPNNPVATSDQRDIERIAMRVRDMPAVRAARQKAALLWRTAYGHQGASDEAYALFDAAMDEYAFNYILKAVNSDTNYPRIVQNFMPPHEWFGMKVSGARMGGDNPDNCYRLIPIAHGARYEVRGRRFARPPSSVTYTLVANYGTSKTIMTLEQDDVRYEADGDSFVITIDGEPANGRPNHLTTAPGVKFLFVRDSFNDWETETPNALFARRLDPPDAAPWTEEQMAARAVEAMTDDVPLYYWFTRLCSGKPINTLPKPEASGSLGGLVTQTGIQGWFKLADDEAIIVNYDPAGAAYSGPVMQDWWFRTIDYWNSQTSLTLGHSVPDADGTVTTVVSVRDPGVHNWIGTGGLHDVLVVQRWQGLPKQQVRNGPAISVRLVKLPDLPAALPQGTLMVGEAQRREQIERRKAAFLRRLIDH